MGPHGLVSQLNHCTSKYISPISSKSPYITISCVLRCFFCFLFLLEEYFWNKVYIFLISTDILFAHNIMICSHWYLFNNSRSLDIYLNTNSLVTSWNCPSSFRWPYVFCVVNFLDVFSLLLVAICTPSPLASVLF